jgi:CBS domain-containing protein
MKTLRAKDIMQTKVTCVTSDMDIREVAKLLVEKKISGAPVIDEKARLIGVVTLSDLVQHNLSEDRDVIYESEFYELFPQDVGFKRGFHIEDLNASNVTEVMTPTLITAEVETPVGELASRMLQKRVHRIIITKDQQVRGIVTTMDMLMLIAKT